MVGVLFDIGISLYLESGVTTGKIIVTDEAHKVRPVHILIYAAYPLEPEHNAE